MSELDAEHVEWCHRMWGALVEGGSWGIPRSGLIFVKREGRLVLVAAMPWEDGMPVSAEELREQQDGDFEGCRVHFGEFGVPVVREVGCE